MHACGSGAHGFFESYGALTKMIDPVAEAAYWRERITRGLRSAMPGSTSTYQLSKRSPEIPIATEGKCCLMSVGVRIVSRAGGYSAS